MKFKKFFILLIALFSFSNFCIFAQNSTAGSVASDNNQDQVVESSDNVEENFKLDIQNTNSENAKKSHPVLKKVWSFLRVILSLILVVVIIFLLMNFFKKSGRLQNNGDDTYLRKVSHLNIAPGKSIQVITLLDKGYIVGVTDNNINLIGEVDDKELISAMNISADKASDSSKPKTFGEVLEMFMPSKSSRETSATQTNIYSNVSNDVSDFVKKQRSRLSKKDENNKR